jgi:hypothetical protein
MAQVRWQLLAIPSPDLSLSSRVFREAFSASPELRAGGWVERPVGSPGALVNKFSGAIQCYSEITDDSWQKHHDAVKMHNITEVTLACVPVD